MTTDNPAAPSQANSNFVTVAAMLYAQLIPSIAGESFKETAKRLRDAVGERVQPSVFYKAIKLIQGRLD